MLLLITGGFLQLFGLKMKLGANSSDGLSAIPQEAESWSTAPSGKTPVGAESVTKTARGAFLHV